MLNDHEDHVALLPLYLELELSPEEDHLYNVEDQESPQEPAPLLPWLLQLLPDGQTPFPPQRDGCHQSLVCEALLPDIVR